MDDLILRRQAIDVLDEQIEQCNKSLSSFDISMKDEYAVKVERASLAAFREILEYLPPAQLSTNLAEVGTDLISRQQAIDAIDRITRTDNWQAAVSMALLDLPSTQPEIIYCKDCVKHNKGLGNYEVHPDGSSTWIWKDSACPLVSWRSKAQGHEFDYQFCAYAEKREVTE